VYYPIGKFLISALINKGLSRREAVIACGCHNIEKGLALLDDLMRGKTEAFRHTPLANLPRLLEFSEEDLEQAFKETREQQKDQAEHYWANKGYYTEKYFKPHLWLRTSRTVPQPIFIVAFAGGEVPYKHIPLPYGIVGKDRTFKQAALAQIIRDHYHRTQGSAGPFGEIVSYLVRRYYGDPGLEFSPDGELISDNPAPVPQGKAYLKVGNKTIPDGLLRKIAEVE